jgi:hypothetical protein
MSLGINAIIKKIDKSNLGMEGKMNLFAKVSSLAAQYNGEGVPKSAILNMNKFVGTFLNGRGLVESKKN